MGKAQFLQRHTGHSAKRLAWFLTGWLLCLANVFHHADDDENTGHDAHLRNTLRGTESNERNRNEHDIGTSHVVLNRAQSNIMSDVRF
jgi:hypothetical protein